MKTEQQHNKMIVLTAGGSGGHVYPAQALAEELKKRGYHLALITDSRGRNNYKGELSQIPNYAVLAGALVGKSRLFKLKSLFKTTIGILQAIYILLKLKPKCVVGFGGYASFPACCAAILLGVDLIIHEQNSVMSRTNRFLSKHATMIALSFANTKHIPKDTKTVLTGMPLRQEILDIKNSLYPSSDKLQILVLGGSQGAKVFSDVVPEAVSLLDKKEQSLLKVVQQCRKEDIAHTEDSYKETKTEVVINNFFENMPELYKTSALVISRTGASSVCEIAVVGRASILVPLPSAADDHQTQNALLLAEASIILPQKEFSAKKLADLFKEFLKDDSQLRFMAEQAQKLGIDNCAERFVDAIEKEVF